MAGKTTNADTKRAQEIAKKLHDAADAFFAVSRDLLEIEDLLEDEPFESTRVSDKAEVSRVRTAIALLSRPLLQQAYNWDGYADARARG